MLKCRLSRPCAEKIGSTVSTSTIIIVYNFMDTISLIVSSLMLQNFPRGMITVVVQLLKEEAVGGRMPVTIFGYKWLS